MAGFRVYRTCEGNWPVFVLSCVLICIHLYSPSPVCRLRQAIGLISTTVVVGFRGCVYATMTKCIRLGLISII
ncbi:hypothetical protein GGS24DRAFT_178464 [Hypoxylon argillaceum]|nr:hypothetical protein GGS24DRAFT_178464 [Hypoxylon argillaceum]KAI1152526.1 hypothetical protein F4825DRAFT_306039 [Nemania diffusa]